MQVSLEFLVNSTHCIYYNRLNGGPLEIIDIVQVSSLWYNLYSHLNYNYIKKRKAMKKARIEQIYTNFFGESIQKKNEELELE